MNVFSNPFTDPNDLRHVNITINESQNAVHKGDVFFTVSSETPDDAGMSSVLLTDIADCYLNSFCALFRFSDGQSPDSVFLGYALRSGPIRKHIVRGAQGAIRYNISKSTFREVPLLIPSPAEQRRIAACLSSLDELISAESRRLESLRVLKKGLLQNLFPREGETTPRLRFPEFSAAPEWKKWPLREVCSVNPPANELPQTFIYVDLESVVAGELIKRNRVSREGAPSRAQRLLQSEDVIFQIVRPYQRNNLFVKLNDDAPYVASTGYAQLRAKGSAEFLYHAVHLDSFVDQVIAKCTGSSYPAISSSDLADIPLPVPAGEDEQRRIGTCLGSLDNHIAAQTAKLATLKVHKKGLMQGLFPVKEIGR